MTESRLKTIASHLATGAQSSLASVTGTSTQKKWDKLPTFDELPKFHEFTGCAWEVWGQGDQLGTINMLTEDVVKEGAKEIKTGQTVCLNWPINFPSKLWDLIFHLPPALQPVFSRKSPDIRVIARTPTALSRDDEIHLNTQSGSQWDGLRHFGVQGHNVFYGNTPTTFFKAGQLETPDPLNVDQERIKYGIHNWAQHGICGRAILLDLVRFFTRNGDTLPYDPWTSHSFSVPELEACAKFQGVEFRPADILIIRAGNIKRYNESSQEEKDKLSASEETFAGIEQSEDMKRFLWNNHFAAIASDQPALERWPPIEGKPHMHQTIIGLWGMPIGEFFDLEGLSQMCEKTGRYSFFFTSWPLNLLGGCASPPNAAAYF